MVEDTADEKDFRERYAFELRKKKVERTTNPQFGLDEIADEVERIRRQEMITPKRRGEQIKREEISNEIIRRRKLSEVQKDAKEKMS